MEKEVEKCQNCRQDFAVEREDFDFYEKVDVPPPTWCSTCRFQRRLAFMADKALYKRECDLCGKSVVTHHAPDRDLIVYCNTCWWGDGWDPLEYGKEYDDSRPFLEQLKELIRETPQVAFDSNFPTLLNSEYVNHCATAKNCYLIFTADECENVLYSEFLMNDKDSMDSSFMRNSELCYEVIGGGVLHKAFFSEDCINCHDVFFSKDCIGCSDCIGCIGLRKKRYHIFNQAHSKEEYEKKLKEFRFDSYKNVEQLKKKAREFWLTYPHKFSHGVRNLNTTGDYVYGAKNAKDMYIVSEGVEDSRYCQLMTMPGIKDSYDYTIWGHDAQRIYECMIVGEGAHNIKFSCQVWPNVRNVEYSYFVVSSSDMFGCANIRSKKHCILNKQYSEKEYTKLRQKIIDDMKTVPYTDKVGRIFSYGEFLSNELSVCSYNESYAHNFFPLKKDEAEKKGFTWYTPPENSHEPTMKANQIKDSIHDVEDSITGEIIECESCKNPFLIVPAELTLLRRFALPIPRKCANCRYAERLSRINPHSLWHRRCMCNDKLYENTTKHAHHENGQCPNEFETSYAPDRKEIVYCEQCYQAEVV